MGMSDKLQGFTIIGAQLSPVGMAEPVWGMAFIKMIQDCLMGALELENTLEFIWSATFKVPRQV